MSVIDNHGRASRALPFPLRDPLSIDATTPDEPIEFDVVSAFPSDPDEKIDIKINLSLNEYVTIASAIDIGRDIQAGVESPAIWWLWTRIYKGLANTMSCEDVADCVESELVTNNTLINQITNTVNQNGFGNVNRVNGTLTKIADRNSPDFNTTEIKTLEDCNRDKLWAGIRNGIVDRLDEQLQDVLQDLSAIPTIIGRNAAWLDVIPVLGDIAEAVVTSLSSVVPTLLSLYESYSSEATKDELACELFSLVCADCRYPTHQELYDYFKNYGLPATPSIGDWVLETMTELLTNPVGVAGKVAYFTLMTWQLGIMYLQATFNGQTGSNAIFRFASLGEDYANDNWLTLCDSCNENYVLWEWDFRTQGQGDFYLDTAQTGQQGVFEAGKGWRCVNYSTGRRFVIARKFDPTWEVRAVAMLVTGDVGGSWAWVRRPTWGSTAAQQGSSAGASNEPTWTRLWEGYPSLSGINEVYFYTQWGGQAAEAHLAKVAFLFNVGHAPAGSGTPTDDLTPFTSP